MKDFDKNLRKQIQEDNRIPDKINQLFSDFESEVKQMETYKNTGVIKHFKLAYILTWILGILVGPTIVYATIIPQEWKISIKEFFGIISNESYEEQKIEINKTEYSNGNTLTLKNYGIDSNTLLLSYNLKTKNKINLQYPFPEEPDYFFKDAIKIIDDCGNEYEINDILQGNGEDTTLVYKISDMEYEIYEIFTIDTTLLTFNNTICTDFILYELPQNANGLEYKEMGEFQFDINFNKDIISHEYEEFNIDKQIIWNSEFLIIGDEVGNPLNEPIKTTEDTHVRFNKITNTKFVSKISCILEGGYYTNVDYTISISDENGNVILDKKTEYLYGLAKADIIVPKLDMNSKINISVYEISYTEKGEEEIEKGSIKIDLKELENLAFEGGVQDNTITELINSEYKEKEKYSQLLDPDVYGLGDSNGGTLIESNYDQYNFNTENEAIGVPIEKYTNKIIIKMGMINYTCLENLDNINMVLDENGNVLEDKEETIEDALLYQSNEFNNNWDNYYYGKNEFNEKLYFQITGMTIMNGNNTTEEDYNNYSRAKKIKISFNNETEKIVNLLDTPKVQFIDLSYVQYDISKPVQINIEVLETYKGDKSNDTYIADIQFGIESNIPQTR